MRQAHTEGEGDTYVFLLGATKYAANRHGLKQNLHKMTKYDCLLGKKRGVCHSTAPTTRVRDREMGRGRGRRKVWAILC